MTSTVLGLIADYLTQHMRRDRRCPTLCTKQTTNPIGLELAAMPSHLHSFLSPVLGTDCGLSKAFAARRRVWRSPFEGPFACCPPRREDCQRTENESCNEAHATDEIAQQQKLGIAYRKQICRGTGFQGLSKTSLVCHAPSCCSDERLNFAKVASAFRVA